MTTVTNRHERLTRRDQGSRVGAGFIRYNPIGIVGVVTNDDAPIPSSRRFVTPRGVTNSSRITNRASPSGTRPCPAPCDTRGLANPSQARGLEGRPAPGARRPAPHVAPFLHAIALPRPSCYGLGHQGDVCLPCIPPRSPRRSMRPALSPETPERKPLKRLLFPCAPQNRVHDLGPTRALVPSLTMHARCTPTLHVSGLTHGNP